MFPHGVRVVTLLRQMGKGVSYGLVWRRPRYLFCDRGGAWIFYCSLGTGRTRTLAANGPGERLWMCWIYEIPMEGRTDRSKGRQQQAKKHQ